MLRPETKARARAVQLLYAWELQGRPPISAVGTAILGDNARRKGTLETAVPLAQAVVSQLDRLDAEITQAADNWRLDRIGAIERNILRLGSYELLVGDVPPRVILNEAVRLARWFGGGKAPAFVNGVLDAVARRLGRL